MAILPLPKTQPQSLSFRNLGKLQLNNPELLKCTKTQNRSILETQSFKKPFSETALGSDYMAHGLCQLQ